MTSGRRSPSGGLRAAGWAWYGPVMKEHTYPVRIEPADEGGYDVFVPALLGRMTQGETFAEAVAMAPVSTRVAVQRERQTLRASPRFTETTVRRRSWPTSIDTYAQSIVTRQ
jgi:predicted RNase H-like HicB family nuclease